MSGISSKGTGWRMFIALLASFRANSAHVWNCGREALQYSEIAAVLKIRTSTVGEFLRRAIKQLRQWNICLR